MHRTPTLITLLVLLAAALTACTLSSSTEDSPPTSTPTPPNTQPLPVTVFLGAPEGDTTPYGPVGCDSYLVPLNLGELPPDTSTDQHIAAALNALFAVAPEAYAGANLFNALELSTLAVDSVTLDADGLATIALSGDVMLSGVCADALFAEQIRFTAGTITGVTDTAVQINGVPLADVISGRGE